MLSQLEERAARANPAVNEASALVLSRLTKLVEPRTHLEDEVRQPAPAAAGPALAGTQLQLSLACRVQILETWEDQASSEADCSDQLEAMAAHLHQDGCSAEIQVAAGGGGNGECLRNLRHTFLTYSSRGTGGLAPWHPCHSASLSAPPQTPHARTAACRPAHSAT